MKKRSLIFDSALIYFFCMLGFIFLRVLTQVLVRFFHITIDDTLDFVLNLISQVGIMFLLPVLLLSLFQKQKVKTTLYNFGFSKIQVLPIIISIVIGFLCYFLNNAIASFFSNMLDLVGYETLPSISSTVRSTPYTLPMFLLNVLTTAILPCVCEETAHRGLLLKGSYSLGITNALILSSVMFGLMHLNINQFFYATILGFIIGVVAVVSKNIIPAIIIHFINNFLNVYISFARTNNLFGSKFYTSYINFMNSGDNFIVVFLKNFLILMALIFTIVFLISLLLKETRIKKVNKMLTDIANINREYNPNNPFYQNNSNLMNLQFLNNLMKQYNIKDLNSMIIPETEVKRVKPNIFQIVLITACVVTGALVTLSTFLWGII